MTPTIPPTVLRHFNISDLAFLGSGGEALVYGLDDERVVRLYRPGSGLSQVEKRTAFCRRLYASQSAIQTPYVIETGQFDGIHFCIERRIQGTSLANALENLNGNRRAAVLMEYARAATHVRTLPSPGLPFGELLAEHPVTHSDWCEFLRLRAAQSFRKADAQLQSDVPHLAARFETWAGSLERTIGEVSPALVHGDYFPGNVMVGQSGAVTGIIDLGPLTVTGDWRLDLAGALIFLEVTESCVDGDANIVRTELNRLCSSLTEDVLGCYRGYYSFYFCLTRTISPRLYAWCVRNLREL